MNQQVYLDPDFRRDPMTNRFCVRCQKDIRPDASTVRVDVNWDTMRVWLDENGQHLMGIDCAKKIGLAGA